MQWRRQLKIWGKIFWL